MLNIHELYRPAQQDVDGVPQAPSVAPTPGDLIDMGGQGAVSTGDPLQLCLVPVLKRTPAALKPGLPLPRQGAEPLAGRHS